MYSLESWGFFLSFTYLIYDEKQIHANAVSNTGDIGEIDRQQVTKEILKQKHPH